MPAVDRILSILVLVGCVFGLWYLTTNQSGAVKHEFCPTVQACPQEVW